MRITVSFVREQALLGGPFPLRQHLPDGAYRVGTPPQHLRKFVVSHAWESEAHPSPSGDQMRRLAATLAALDPPARDEDLVFFDFCSLPQSKKMGLRHPNGRNAAATEYFARNNVPFISRRSASEKAAFSYAMWDMGRLYAFEECEVLVLPSREADVATMLANFPGGNEWGQVSVRPYKNRGWPCAEFAIARHNGTIANLDDPDVVEVLRARDWPCTVAQYEEMLTNTLEANPAAGLKHDPELGVDFTDKGDRDIVKYFFFKMTRLTHEFLDTEGWLTEGWQGCAASE